MDKIFFFIEKHPVLISIGIVFLGGVGFLIKKWFFNENTSAVPFIKAGVSISAGGDIVVGNKVVQHVSSNTDTNVSATDRLTNILFDAHNWQYDGLSKAYYKSAPEFTLEYDSKEQAVEERWWGNFLGKVTKFDIVFKYHATALKTASCCRFEGEAFSIPYPDVDYVRIDVSRQKDAPNTYSLFYFLEDSFEFALLFHLFGANASIVDKENRERLFKKDAIASQVKPPIRSLPFIVFKNNEEKNAFIKKLEGHIGDFFRQKAITPTMQLGAQKLQEEKAFAYWAYDLFFKLKDIE